MTTLEVPGRSSDGSEPWQGANASAAPAADQIILELVFYTGMCAGIRR